MIREQNPEQKHEQKHEQNREQETGARMTNFKPEQAENEQYKSKSKNKSIPNPLQVDTGPDVENLPDCGKPRGGPDVGGKAALCPVCGRPVVPISEAVRSPKHPSKLLCRRCRRAFWRAECVKTDRGGGDA